MSGWIGVDLDGTLAHYTDWKGPYHIGEPIPKMLRRVRLWVRWGREVRIMTARVCSGDPQGCTKLIQDWCETHIGVRLRVTCEKDYGMWMLYDDRCRQVRKNTGHVVRETPAEIDAEMGVGG